jgi:hypothetical protein
MTTGGRKSAILDLRELARLAMPRVEPVDASLRGMAIATWRGRMVNEHGSAKVFEGLAGQLERAEVEPEIVAEVLGFANEERTHGILCGAVVEALGGEAIADALIAPEFPSHADASPLEAVIRNLLSITCLSETVAVALIGAERLKMPDGELRTLLTRIYADECGHANFGWRLLPRLLERARATEDPGLDERLGAYLEVAFAHLVEHELAHLPVGANPPPEGAAIGLCSGITARALFYATVEQVIVPGLSAQGLPAERAWRAVMLSRS